MYILFIMTTFSFLTISASADELVYELPYCSEPELILSRLNIPCKLDQKLPSEFDIPELKIDLDQLDKIFSGAESSGGHVIGPQDTMQRTQQPRTFPLHFQCEARLLSDGEKTLSFLSIQKFILTHFLNDINLTKHKWKHYVVAENSLYPKEMYSVPVPPAINLADYSVNIKYLDSANSSSFVLNACESSTASYATIRNCAEVEKSPYFRTLKTRLKTIEFKTREKLNITKTLQVKCVKKH